MYKEGPWGVYFRNAEPGEAIELVVWDGVGHRIKKLSRKQAMNTLMNLANTMASQQLLEEEAPLEKSIAGKIFDAEVPEEWAYKQTGYHSARSFINGAWCYTFSNEKWDEAHVANGVFDTTAAYESEGPLSHLEGAVVVLEQSMKPPLGTCCTSMVGPGRGDIGTPTYSGPDRRDELRGDRRVNKDFSSNTPNLRKKQFHAEWGGHGDDPYRWGRRITDPVAY